MSFNIKHAHTSYANLDEEDSDCIEQELRLDMSYRIHQSVRYYLQLEATKLCYIDKIA